MKKKITIIILLFTILQSKAQFPSGWSEKNKDTTRSINNKNTIMEKFNSQTELLKLLAHKKAFVKVYNIEGTILVSKKELKNLIKYYYLKNNLFLSGYVVDVIGDKASIIYFKKNDPDAIIGK